jgi:hypothetical protein
MGEDEERDWQWQVSIEYQNYFFGVIFAGIFISTCPDEMTRSKLGPDRSQSLRLLLYDLLK